MKLLKGSFSWCGKFTDFSIHFFCRYFIFGSCPSTWFSTVISDLCNRTYLSEKDFRKFVYFKFNSVVLWHWVLQKLLQETTEAVRSETVTCNSHYIPYCKVLDAAHLETVHAANGMSHALTNSFTPLILSCFIGLPRRNSCEFLYFYSNFNTKPRWI